MRLCGKGRRMSDDVVTGNWECWDVEHFVDALMDSVEFGQQIVLKDPSCIADIVKITAARLVVPPAMLAMEVQALISDALGEANQQITDVGRRDVIRAHLENYYRRHSLLRDIEYYQEV